MSTKIEWAVDNADPSVVPGLEASCGRSGGTLIKAPNADGTVAVTCVVANDAVSARVVETGRPSLNTNPVATDTNDQSSGQAFERGRTGAFGHGTFIYQPDFAVAKHGSAAGVATAIKDMRMSHAWLRAHGKNGLWKEQLNRQLADALRQEGISVGIWGWCDGNDVARDLRNAKDAIASYAPDIYVADIEHDVSGASWSVTAAEAFGKDLRQSVGTLPIAVSSFGYIAWHRPSVMTALDPYVDYFAPQVYWFWYPNQKMISQTGLPGIQKRNPAHYAKLCLHHWRQAVSKPLILTGQAYWGEAASWTRSVAENKLATFLAEFDDYDDIVGLNWWSFADSKAMSAPMATAISDSQLDQRFSQSDGVSGPAGPTAANEMPTTDGPRSDRTSSLYWIAAEGLNFRETANADDDGGIITELDYSATAEVSGEPDANGFVRALVRVDNDPTEGYLFAKYLRKNEASKIERAIQEAVSEWLRFDKGEGVEHHDPYSGYINEMWSARGYPHLSGKDRGWPWSAACISFILENAGYERTNFDIRHSTYIHEAIQNRVLKRDRDFAGYRIDEAEPQVGDLLCQWRDYETTYDEAETKSRFPSHTDIIIAVRDRSVITIGGNVSNSSSNGVGVSVETKNWRRGTDGLMVDERRLFAIMKNQHRPIDEQLMRT